MKINNDLAKRGNQWIASYLLTEENSEFVEFQPVPKHTDEIVAVYRVFPNAASKELGVGGRLVNVNYQRLDLKQLYVTFAFTNQDDFYEQVLKEINKVIIKKFGEPYILELDDIDISNCRYNDKMPRIAVKSLSPFWFDFCYITNSLK